MKQYNKPRKSQALFGLGFLETIATIGLLQTSRSSQSFGKYWYLNQNNQKRKLRYIKMGPNKQYSITHAQI